MADVPVTEEIPILMIQNNIGNRFVTVIYYTEFNKGGGSDSRLSYERDDNNDSNNNKGQ